MIFRLFSSHSLAAKGALLRQFHGNAIIRESVKDKVNLKVGQGLASAIEKGEKVTYATKEKLEEGQNHVEKKTGDAAKGARKVKEEMKQGLKK